MRCRNLPTAVCVVRPRATSSWKVHRGFPRRSGVCRCRGRIGAVEDQTFRHTERYARGSGPAPFNGHCRQLRFGEVDHAVPPEVEVGAASDGGVGLAPPNRAPSIRMAFGGFGSPFLFSFFVGKNTLISGGEIRSMPDPGGRRTGTTLGESPGWFGSMAVGECRHAARESRGLKGLR